MSLLVTGEHSFYKFMVLTNKNRVLGNILPGEYGAKGLESFIRRCPFLMTDKEG